MAGILIEKRIAARNVDALNRSAKATVNVDGGNVVALGGVDTKDKDVFVATAPATGGLSGLYMAYDPSERLTVVNGKYFAGLTQDPRDYTNLAGRVMDVFKPQVGDIIGVIAGNVTGGTSTPVAVGNFLEAANSVTTLTKATAQTADVTSFKVIDSTVLPFPQAGIGMQMEKLYICECVHN